MKKLYLYLFIPFLLETIQINEITGATVIKNKKLEDLSTEEALDLLEEVLANESAKSPAAAMPKEIKTIPVAIPTSSKATNMEEIQELFWNGLQNVNVDMTKKALDLGANVNLENPRYHYNPLMYALQNQKPELVLLLLKRDDINLKEKAPLVYHEITPLVELVGFIWPVYRNNHSNKEIFYTLLKKGVDINAKDFLYGNTALIEAAINNNIEAIEMLLEAGANINETNYKGKTFLSIANEKGHEQVLKAYNDFLKIKRSEAIKKVQKEMKEVKKLATFPPGLLPIVTDYAISESGEL